MNRKSLEKELRILTQYLRQVSKTNRHIEGIEAKIISHTIVGMIMTVYNLLKTGAYYLEDNSNNKLYKLIEHARNTAIHYGYFNDLNNIYPEIKKILSNLPDPRQVHFAETLKYADLDENITQHQCFSTSKGEIKLISIPDDYVVFTNKITGQEVYVKTDDLIIIKNKLNNDLSYLLSENDNEIFFLKNNPDSITDKVSFNKLLEINFFAPFKTINKANKLIINLNRILKELDDNPYKNLVIKYKYNNKTTSITAHNLLKELLYKRSIDERILTNNFTLHDFDNSKEVTTPLLDKLNIKELVAKATLSDIFFMELFIKRVESYLELKQHAKDNNLQISNYTKQSFLINLFTIGAESFSDKFLYSDKTGELANLYHSYRSCRNELAHFATSDKQDKETLISNLEEHTNSFYAVICKVYDSYCKEKMKQPTLKLPKAHKLDENHTSINNKTNNYVKLKHLKDCKIINGKKYLKLDIINQNIYVELDKGILSLDYDTRASDECLLPIDNIKFVEIDPTTNKIKPSNYKVEKNNLVSIDTYLDTLMQAYDIFKTYPQFKKTSDSQHLCVITFFDKHGTPIYSEGVKNLLYRRFSQKIIPSNLLETSTLVIPTNIDEPLTILNKNKVIVAKVYLACINSIGGEEIITQLLKNKKEKTIGYGKLLPKDLKTSDVITITKEGR